MNRHRDDVALVMDSADFRRDSHVRARTAGLGADLDNVVVRPTILLHDRRYERRVEAAAGALVLQAAQLHALLAEPLTRPLGSMQTPRCFVEDEAITLIQNKPVGAASPSPARPHRPADYRHDRDLARHIAASASMRGSGMGGERQYAPRGDDHARHVAPAEAMLEHGSGSDHHYSAQLGPMRDAEPLRHVAPPVSLRGCGSSGDRHSSAPFAPLHSQRDRRAPSGEHYQATPMCEELPTDDGLRYGESERRKGAAAASPCEAAAQAGTYHGLRHVREHAHARLESLEAAAVSGRTAAARPHNARARNGAADVSVVRQPGATPSANRSAKPRYSTAEHKRKRSEGLTDARNALRRAYAESKLRLPNAPPRSSARSAGVVDGWERLPDKLTRRARSRRKGSRAIWPWAAALAVSSMFFAYTLTLTVVSEPGLAQSPQPTPAEAAPKAPASPLAPTPTEQPPVEKLTASTRPRATGPKSPKPPTRAGTHAECREQTPPSN